MTKAAIIEKMYRHLGRYTRAEIEKYTNIIFDEMRTSLLNHESLHITGFGRFVVHYKKGRIGSNPKTKQKLQIPSRWIVTFFSGQLLKQRVNRK